MCYIWNFFIFHNLMKFDNIVICVSQLIKFRWRKTLYREHLIDAPSFSGRWIGIYLAWKRSIKTRKTYVEHLKACHANDLWMHCSTFQESFDQGFVYAVCCSMFFSFCHQFGTYLAKNVANSHNLILDYLFTACWIPSMYMIGNIVWNEICK